MYSSQIRLIGVAAKLVCNERSVQLKDEHSFTQLKPGEYALNSPEILKDKIVSLKYDIW